MRIDTPDPELCEEGDYGLLVMKGYGNPRAIITLDKKGDLELREVRLDDCDRLIRAATQAREKIAAYRAEMEAPHGRTHLHKGTCQLCGKPDADELHAEPKPLVISESTIEQARLVAEDIEAGTWPPKPEPEQAFGLCPVNHVNGVHGCTLKPGHDGPHQSVEPLSGHVRNEWADEPASPEAAALDAAITAGTPVFVVGDEPKCRAKHSQERYVCTVPKGHDGPHQARGPQGELYASWNAETAASVTA